MSSCTLQSLKITSEGARNGEKRPHELLSEKSGLPKSVRSLWRLRNRKAIFRLPTLIFVNLH